MTRIVFTSCCRYDAFPKQPWWADIEAENPDYLFLLGDMIYMDYGIWPFSREPLGSPRNLSDDEFRSRMERKYSQQWENVPEFKRLFDKMLDRNAVFGTWDDHDFACNNSYGAGHSKDRVSDSKQNIARELFLKHYPLSTNKPHIYFATDIPGARVIFLDNRSHATHHNEPDATLIGGTQFQYLADHLDPDQLNLVCAGLTLTLGSERWDKYEAEYRELTKLLSGIPNVLYLGGDIHSNRFEVPGSSRPCYEIVSSGIAVNTTGIPGKLDDRHNWGMLDINASSVNVTLVNRWNCRKSYRIRIR